MRPSPADQTNASGLTEAEVEERRADGRVNVTSAGTSRTVGAIIRANVVTRFNLILGVLFLVVVSTGAFGDAVFGVVVVVNSAIGIAQEFYAKRKLDRIALLNAPTTTVVRDGATVPIPTVDVVQDDLVELRAGDQVPADGLLLVAEGLEVEESNLTGESDAVHRSVGEEVRSGTSVVAGSGRFRATAVGPASYASRLAQEARRFTRVDSEIQSSINRLLSYITWVILLAAPLAVWSQWRALGDDWSEVVLRAAGGLTGLVPEGLVLLASIAFLLAAVQLTRQQVLVQELPAVEGLARVDVVCTDKTGTLTTGVISFVDCEPVGDLDRAEVMTALGALASDPFANATLQAVRTAAPSPEGWERTASLPFSSERKRSSAEFRDRGSWHIGAPEMLLPPDHPATARAGELAASGLRVLALLHAPGPLDEGPTVDARPVALVTLVEEARPDAADTLAYLRGQGVRVIVISGDNPQTVAAVARHIGLDVPPETVVDARTPVGDDAALRDALVGSTVFGRVQPEQKQAMVRELQAGGHVVAMTGDGVNDALALKDADIGIAMGNGAPATKAVAELVLLDGRFGHLPRVLAEGRRVIANVERVASLFVAKNVMSLMAIVTAAIFTLPFPLLPRHLTLVSATTIGIPAFFLALGPSSRRYIPGFLARVLRFSIPAGLVCGLVVITSYGLTQWFFDVPTPAECAVTGPLAGKSVCEEPSTGATIALLTSAMWIVVVLARPFRPWKVAVVAGCVALSVLAFTVPIARDFFEFEASPDLVLIALGVGAVGAGLVELIYRLQPDIRAASRH